MSSSFLSRNRGWSWLYWANFSFYWLIFWWLSWIKPYKIQEDLMKAIYTVIEDRKIGIFESPTGTGKSKFKTVDKFVPFASCGRFNQSQLSRYSLFLVSNDRIFHRKWIFYRLTPAICGQRRNQPPDSFFSKLIGRQLLTNWIFHLPRAAHLHGNNLNWRPWVVMNIVVMQNRLASLFRILNWLKLNFTGDGEPKRLCGLCGINNIALQ